MGKLNEEANSYEAPTMKNITDLKEVPTDVEVVEEVFKEGTEDEFKVKVVRIDGESYRVPVSVLKNLKAILEHKPDLKKIKVTKSGTGMNTEYTVIPLE